MNFMKNLIFVTCVMLFGLVMSAPREDLVEMDIDGYNYKWYSGFLNFSTGNYHYVYFQSQSNPQNDPVLLWLNGGPGCSSLIGMVTENGPFVFIENTTTLKLNPTSWNKKANVLYLESPGGVGFSESKRGIKHDDGTVAEDNYQALIAFFAKYPELKKNDFYISGQSYAGIYIPYLTLNIVNKNKQAPDTQKINLKGILVGNACTDPKQCYEPTNSDPSGESLSMFQYQNLFNHGFLSNQVYTTLVSACDNGRYATDSCRVLRKKADTIFQSSKAIIYNLYAPCMHQKVVFPQVDLATGHKFYTSLNGKKYKLSDDGTVCEDLIGIQTFFNTKTVQNSLHVPNIRYDMCSDSVGDNYKMFANASYWIYPLLMKEPLRIWVYEGDVDNSVPITGTVYWVNKLRTQYNLKVVEEWRSWAVPGKRDGELQIGGMVWKLQNFTLVSVRGAGHMVPQDKRAEAFIMFDTFLAGKDLPRQTQMI